MYLQQKSKMLKQPFDKTWTDHKDDMRKLNTGDKPDEKLIMKKAAMQLRKALRANKWHHYGSLSHVFAR